MTWNYRVMKHKVDLDNLSESIRTLLINRDDNYWYGIHEVYYDENGDVSAWTEALEPFGETPDELRKCFELMLLAFDKEILDYEKPDKEFVPDLIAKDEPTDEDKTWAASIMKERGIDVLTD